MPPLSPHIQRARRTDPDTSKAAAAAISDEEITRIQGQILALLTAHGAMTHATLIQLYRQQYDGTAAESTIRTRCAELVDAGKVRDSGLRVKLPSGRHAALWRVTP